MPVAGALLFLPVTTAQSDDVEERSSGVSNATPSSGKDQTAHVHPHQPSDNNPCYLPRALSHQHAASGRQGQTDRSSYRDHHWHNFTSEISGGLLILANNSHNSGATQLCGVPELFTVLRLRYFLAYISYLRFMSYGDGSFKHSCA